MENGSVPYATEVSDDIQRIEESNSLDTGLTIPEEEVDDLVKLNKGSMEPVNAAEMQDQCWSLDNWDLPEYPLQRKEISLRAMIMEIHQKQQNYKLYVLEEITVIQLLFEILYVFQVEDTQIGGTQIEDMLKKIASSKSKGNTTKAINLYYALKYVKELAQERSVSLDVECFIVETHKRIMGPEEEGGVFSTKRRFGKVDKNTFHEYPTFDSERSALRAVQSVIDQYNTLLKQIILFNEDSIKDLENLFKLCGMLLFKIMYYHPFGDGNGRLARLLTSDALSLITPFPTPVYGLFSPSTRAEYVDALVEGRQPNGNASILTALIIESTYYTWKKFDEVLKMAKNGENWKELLQSCANKVGK